jgi:hypothetical protein
MDGDAGTRAGAPRNLRRETDKAKTGFRGDPGRAADTVSVTASAIEVVPESSTWAMPLLGFAGLGFAGYRQRRKLAGAASV